MTLAQLLELAEERGRKIGFEEGLKLGIEEGVAEVRNRMLRLTEILLESDRIEDLKRATKDKDYSETLYEEFGLK